MFQSLASNALGRTGAIAPGSARAGWSSTASTQDSEPRRNRQASPWFRRSHDVRHVTIRRAIMPERKRGPGRIDRARVSPPAGA
jgi:hypothetical protein